MAVQTKNWEIDANTTYQFVIEYKDPSGNPKIGRAHV